MYDLSFFRHTIHGEASGTVEILRCEEMQYRSSMAGG